MIELGACRWWLTDRVALDQELLAARRPRDVVDVAGSWIAEALGEHGFCWLVKSRIVQRQVGDVVQQVALQASSYNRVGGLISVSTYVAVRDPVVRTWRLAHPHVVAEPADRDLVCGHLLGYASGRANGYVYGDAQDGDIDLTDPAQRVGHLHRFMAMMREGVLPWFAEASDPDSIVGSRAGDYTVDPVAVLEWLAFHGRFDLVHSYAERYRARHPGTEQRWADGTAAAHESRPCPHGGDSIRAMAWSATMLTTNPL
ncbi:hypothetical protein ACN27B_30125 [Micromonospora sp. WMMD754]|uniref:hypothetical protein n=1 Tax=Micromonospora sp. WMMD754 TaxID=3404114 RepID=UPI003BF462DF